MGKKKRFCYSKISLPIILSLIFSNGKELKAEEQGLRMEEIVVTATRIEEPKSETPSFVQTIPQETIELSPSQNLGDLLTEAGIGHVHKYPGFLTGRVSIRGLASDLFDQQKSRVLFLIDGVRGGTVNFSKISLDDVERVEILKGPASVVYGSQAMGGVINVITKRAKEEGIKGEVEVTGGSWDYYKGRAELMGKKGMMDFYFSASRSAQNDYHSKGYGKIPNTSWDAEATSAKIGFKPKKEHDFLFSFQYLKGWKIGSPGARYNPSLTDYSDKGRFSYQLEYSNPFSKAKLFYSKDEDEWHYPTKGDITKKTTKTSGAYLLGNYTFKNLIKVIGGIDYNLIEVTSKRKKGAPYYPNSDYDTFGIFSEGRLPLLRERLLLSAGVRYDHFSAEIKRTPNLKVNPRTRNFENFTARGGFVIKVKEGFNLKGNLGSGFRAPAPDELAADYVSSWGVRYLGNPDLDPERSLTFDLGVEYYKSPLKLQTSYFISSFKDKIVTIYNSTTKTNTYQNVDGAEIQGFELNFSMNISPYLKIPFYLEPYADLTYHTKYTSKDEREIKNYNTHTLLWTPKWTGTFGLRLGDEKWSLNFYGVYTGKEKVIDWNWNSPTYGKAIDKKDFTIFNLGFKIFPVKHFEGTLKVENLFNKAYEYVKAYPMPERTVYVGAKLKF